MDVGHGAPELVDAAAGHQRGGAGRAEQAGGPADVVGVHAADPRRLLGRPRGNKARQLVEAVAPRLHERLVTKPLADDRVQKAQGQNRVGARAHGQPQISDLGGLGLARVDHHERPLAGGIGLDMPPEGGVIGLGGVRAPQDEAFREPGDDIGLHGPAEGDHVHPDARVPADLPDAHVVRRAEAAHESVERPKRAMRAADGAGQSGRTVLLGERRKPRGEVVQRLVPAHPLPSTAPPLSHPPRGVVHAVRRIQRPDVHGPALAGGHDRGAVGVAGRIGAQPRHAALLHRRDDGAGVAAILAVARTLNGLAHRASPSLAGRSSKSRPPSGTFRSFSMRKRRDRGRAATRQSMG